MRIRKVHQMVVGVARIIRGAWGVHLTVVGAVMILVLFCVAMLLEVMTRILTLNHRSFFKILEVSLDI